MSLIVLGKVGRRMVRTESLVPTARDYVQDGLVAMWDGIENAGWGVHDAAATVWKNLVDSSSLELKQSLSWTDESLRWNQEGGFGLTVDSYPVLTAEMTFCVNKIKTNTFGALFGGAKSAGVSGPIGPARVLAGGTLSVMGDTSSGYVFGRASEGVRSSVSLTRDGSFVTAYQNATQGTRYSYSPTNERIVINDLGGFSGRSMLLDVFSFRLYNRALTPAEIAHNHSVDRARFNIV